MTKTIPVTSHNRVEFIEVTDRITDVVAASGVLTGSVMLYVPHTTAAVTINENADPDVTIDMIKGLNKLVPFEDNYRHLEGNSAAHIKSSLIGFSEHLIIDQGKLLLGTWQGIYFCEFDGPRIRKLIIRITGDQE